MNNEIKVYNFNEFEVKTIKDEKGEPWFIAKDVCNILELDNVSRAVSRLDDEEKAITTGNTPGGDQNLIIINESGLYSLILSSRKPEAKAFKKWVTSEVLPSIRKTGSYSIQLLSPAEILLAQAQALVEQEKEIKKVNHRLDVIEAKVTTSPQNYFSIAGYCSLHKIPCDANHAKSLGKIASKMSKNQGMYIGKIHDERYGQVNTYSDSILKMIL